SRTQIQRILLISAMVALTYFLYLHANISKMLPIIPEEIELIQRIPEVDFEGFNNETGVNEYIVPNIVHFVRFNQPEFSFVEAVTVLAAFKNQKPDKIMFHTDSSNFTGKHWEKIVSTPGLVYELVKTTIPDSIFNQKLNEGWQVYHGGDVTRIKTLMKYGGIYLDNDAYIIQSLDRFRKFEFTIGWDYKAAMGNQILLANKDARFLPLWLESYKDYHRDKWYENAGFIPTREILEKRPELVHRVNYLFGVHISFTAKLYKVYWKDWRTLYCVHLLTNHRYYLDKENYEQYPSFDEENIKNYNYTFGEMAREAYGIS
ncbi:hypothetical protein L9F63_018772, partial [Diploptera punctata]